MIDMARKNLKIGTDVYERHRERKEYYGLSWEEYLDAGCPEIPTDE